MIVKNNALFPRKQIERIWLAYITKILKSKTE